MRDKSSSWQFPYVRANPESCGCPVRFAADAWRTNVTAQQTDNGFVIEPEGGSNSRVRRPVAVYVSLTKNAGAPQDLSFQTKSLAGREIRYRIDKSEGGSGGETYTLEAYEIVPTGQIEYSQAMQSEYEEPDFVLSWSIIQATKLNAASR